MPDLLTGLGAVVERAGQLIPTRAGMLFFGHDPQAWIPHSQVLIARFQGTSTTHFIDRADLRGTLPEMIDAAEQFIRRPADYDSRLARAESGNLVRDRIGRVDRTCVGELNCRHFYTPR